MASVDLTKIEAILPQVKKPGRYIGREFIPGGAGKTDPKYRFAFCFPDVYEVGMSYLGLKILYELINKRADFACERVFAPWSDMEEEMRKQDIPLFGLEAYTPLDKFDVVGFSLPYQLNYSNILNMLNLGGIPRLGRQRLSPLVIAGGGGCFNPEPLSDFFDAFLIGDGEELLNEVLDVYAAYAPLADFAQKEQFLRQLSKVSGVYVPDFYAPEYDPSGRFVCLKPKDTQTPLAINRRLQKQLGLYNYEHKFPVPYVETIHERISLEVMRGCVNGCRFCEAGFTQRPRRERAVENVLAMAKTAYGYTGFDEISLLSLSSADYSALEETVIRINAAFENEKVSISLPSLRIEDVTAKLPQHLSRVKKTGLTFAPEAATQRLRRVINKNIDMEKLKAAARQAYAHGWQRIKLYFMIGLPGETAADLEAILELCAEISELKRAIDNAPALVVASIANFVPKPHTPFQWGKMNSQQEFSSKQEFIRSRLKNKKIMLKFHNPAMSVLEGIISRGDRRLGAVIETAVGLGARFDAWDEHFNFSLWQQALERHNISMADYLGERNPHESLPWDHIHGGVSKDFLKEEYKKAQDENVTLSCQKQPCSYCGACEGRN